MTDIKEEIQDRNQAAHHSRLVGEVTTATLRSAITSSGRVRERAITMVEIADTEASTAG